MTRENWANRLMADHYTYKLVLQTVIKFSRSSVKNGKSRACGVPGPWMIVLSRGLSCFHFSTSVTCLGLLCDGLPLIFVLLFISYCEIVKLWSIGFIGV